MGEIRPKRCEGRELTKDQLAVSVDGFEPTNLADSDEEPEEGAGSVAGPEKTELAAERAGDWVRAPPHCD